MVILFRQFICVFTAMKPAYEHVEFGEDCSLPVDLGVCRVFHSNGIIIRSTNSR